MHHANGRNPVELSPSVRNEGDQGCCNLDGQWMWHVHARRQEVICRRPAGCQGQALKGLLDLHQSVAIGSPDTWRGQWCDTRGGFAPCLAPFLRGGWFYLQPPSSGAGSVGSFAYRIRGVTSSHLTGAAFLHSPLPPTPCRPLTAAM